MNSESGTQGYGFMSEDLKNVEMAPSGENSSGIPAAQPVDIMTYGDPNGSSIDAKDGHTPGGTDEARYGF